MFDLNHAVVYWLHFSVEIFRGESCSKANVWWFCVCYISTHIVLFSQGLMKSVLGWPWLRCKSCAPALFSGTRIQLYPHSFFSKVWVSCALKIILRRSMRCQLLSCRGAKEIQSSAGCSGRGCCRAVSCRCSTVCCCKAVCSCWVLNGCFCAPWWKSKTPWNFGMHGLNNHQHIF